jgi:outer membrane receptor protein involved in Fe transport
MKKTVLLFSALLCAIFASPADAQTTATLAGQVTDEQRAAVSGATVEAINVATNIVLTATTNEDGRYVFTELQPGAYRLRIQKEGFQTTVKEEVILNVAARATQNFQLKIGEVTATVTVEGEPALVERDSPTVSTVVTRDFVENIPLNGRSFQSLLELTPGVVLSPATATNPGQFSVNGQRTNSNYFTLDGVSANAGTTPIATSSQQAAGTLPSTTVLGGFNNLASVDELQEFRVQTSVFAPEFGRTPGAQVSLITRSGGNRLTGSVFNYVRNEKFDANSFFNNRNGIPRGVLRQNDFGFTLGGPLFLPRFGEGGSPFYSGRDRTFFFVSYEGLRLRQPVFRSANVPSLQARARAAQLGLSNISTLLNAFPLPNAAPTTNDPLIGRFVQSLSNPVEVNSFGIRLDHNITSRFNIFGRYKHTPSSSDQATTAFPNQTNFFSILTRLLTFGSTYAASSKLSFDFRGNYTDSIGDFLFTGQEINGAQLPDLATLLPSYVGESNASVSLQFGSLINQTRGRSFGNGQRQLNLVGSSTFLVGNHQLKFGSDYRRLRPKVNARSFGITYNFGSLNEAIEALATRGTVRVQVQALAPAGQFTFENYSAFAQDTWRVNPRLTLTYGVRYDINKPPSSDGAYPYAINGLDNPLTAMLAPQGTKAFETTYNNFAPRVGLAYTIDRDGGFVIRGGFGVFYDLATGQATRGYASFPFNSLTPLTRVPFIPGSAALNAALQPAPFNLNPPYSSEFFVYGDDIKLPYTLQYNVALEKSLGERQSVSLTYVGARGRRLLFTELLRNTPADVALGIPANVVLNPIFGTGASFSNVSVTDNRGRSDYNALQLQFERRLSRGLQALASYTYAKSNDNISSEIAASPALFRVNPETEYAPSDFDIRHTFTAAMTYRIPSPFKSGFGRAALGGFAFDLITRARSAPPYNAFIAYRTAGFITFINRPDLDPNVPLYLEDSSLPGGRRVNPAALTSAPITRQGNLGRNALRAFPLYQTDVALRREFSLWKTLRLQVRAEAFNVFNRANFAIDGNNQTVRTITPTGTIQNLVFGQSTRTLADQLSGFTGGGSTPGFNQLYSVGGPRSMQFAVKLLF